MDKLLIFGRGQYCECKFATVKESFEIIGFLDNSVNDKGYDKKYACDVYNPNHVQEFSNCYVMCMSAAYIDMWKQLINLGVAHNRILFANNLKPYFNAKEEQIFGSGQKLLSGNRSITYISDDGKKYKYNNDEGFKNILCTIVKEKCMDISYIMKMREEPIGRDFGASRGKPIDRYYIEKFLDENSDDIRNAVMEIGGNTYIRKYGREKVSQEIILHVSGQGKNAIKGNFETGEGIKENMADCLICTQTLQYIYDLKTAIKNIYKLLKPKGVALITVPGIKSLSRYDEKEYGERWSFTKESMRQLCLEVCSSDDFIIESFGNVKITTAYLYGVCCEELCETDFKYNDPQYPFLVTVRLQKR